MFLGRRSRNGTELHKDVRDSGQFPLTAVTQYVLYIVRLQPADGGKGGDKRYGNTHQPSPEDIFKKL